MSRPSRKDVEDARNQLPALVAQAARGHCTIITRHGRSIAAIAPVKRADRATPARRTGTPARLRSTPTPW
jgi:prevent-host-death family protein